MVHAELVEIPIVERPVVLVLERADRVRDALDRVRLAVGPVVHGIDAPRVASPVMRGLADAIHDRITQVDVARGHVDLRAQGLGAVVELAGAHACEQVQVLLDRAVAIRALAPGLGQGATVLRHPLGRQIVDVRLAGLDQLHRPRVELLEVVARVVEVLAPVVAEPAHGVDDRIDVLLTLLGRVGVVESQMAAAAEFARHAEVDRDRLGVADVQIAVGLGRKTRDHLAAEAPADVVLQDHLPDEVARLFPGLLAHPVECNASVAPIPAVARGPAAPERVRSAACVVGDREAECAGRGVVLEVVARALEPGR